VLFLTKAIEIAQSVDSDAVRDAMNRIDILTFFGRLKIDPRTRLQIGHKMVVIQRQGGKKVIVWPPEAAEKSPYYPALL